MAQHPSSFLSKELSDIIRRNGEVAENRRQLSEKQNELIHREKWLNMFVPKSLGGLELTLPEILKIEEGLAWADGSTAWVVTLCSGAAWFVGFMDPELTQKIFSERHACFCGSGMPAGTANKNGAGYTVNGVWKYASGSPQATVFTANCIVLENGSAILKEDGSPLICSFLMMRNEVNILDTWRAMGMVATASHSFEVKNLELGKERCFVIDPKFVELPQPVFQYPFLQLAETTLTVNLSGMASRFLELCEEIFQEKMRHRNTFRSEVPDLMQVLEQSVAGLNQKREAFYQAAGKSWHKINAGQILSTELLSEVSKTSKDLAHASREIVGRLFPYCGLKSADTRLEINRVWRNINTAGQHALFDF